MPIPIIKASTFTRNAKSTWELSDNTEKRITYRYETVSLTAYLSSEIVYLTIQS
jgi:hypothetical protein